MKRRHYLTLASFALVVIAPLAVSLWYLESRAADQYESTTGFTVSRVDALPATTGALPTGLGQLSLGMSTDGDILQQFIQSQKLVEQVDARVDLRAKWAKPANDPVFAFDTRGSIEDLVDYWQDMVSVYHDGSSGLIQLRVRAFDPRDARQIARAIVAECDTMINRLSAKARADAIRHAREELDHAVTRLKAARRAITAFRSRTQIVDPQAAIQGQMGVLNTLQQQLASALVKLDLLRETAPVAGPRAAQLRREIAAIKQRIAQERRKFGEGNGVAKGADYASVVDEYEGLSVDLEFAQRNYLSALSAFEAARAEARRQALYLAVFVAPTLAQTAQYPQRALLLAELGLFLALGWGIAVLVAYTVRGRR
ncbi:MAG: sugar transporter [Paracoccaceae bacterium]|nr:sugar transporter [Paracoccaceae bacterium]